MAKESRKNRKATRRNKKHKRKAKDTRAFSKYLRSLSAEKFRAFLNGQAFPSEMWFLEKLNSSGVLNKVGIPKVDDYWRMERNLKIGYWYGDFVYPNMKIVIEIDGKSHNSKDQKAKDRVKNNFLVKMGWKVLRIKYKDEHFANKIVLTLVRVKRESAHHTVMTGKVLRDQLDLVLGRTLLREHPRIEEPDEISFINMVCNGEFKPKPVGRVFKRVFKNKTIIRRPAHTLGN